MVNVVNTQTGFAGETRYPEFTVLIARNTRYNGRETLLTNSYLLPWFRSALESIFFGLTFEMNLLYNG